MQDQLAIARFYIWVNGGQWSANFFFFHFLACCFKVLILFFFTNLCSKAVSCVCIQMAHSTVPSLRMRRYKFYHINLVLS